jgi:hypothetical protein
MPGVWPLRGSIWNFPADCPHPKHFYRRGPVARDTRISQHIARCTSHRHRCDGLRKSNLRTVRFCYSASCNAGHGHFCRALHVAMQSGLYHPLISSGLACSL